MGSNWGYAYANGLLSSLNIFRLLLLGGGLTPQAICPLRRELWLDGCLGIEPRRDGFALPEDLCNLRAESFRLRASIIG
jgi:hypothetical protein